MFSNVILKKQELSAVGYVVSPIRRCRSPWEEDAASFGVGSCSWAISMCIRCRACQRFLCIRPGMSRFTPSIVAPSSHAYPDFKDDHPSTVTLRDAQPFIAEPVGVTVTPTELMRPACWRFSASRRARPAKRPNGLPCCAASWCFSEAELGGPLSASECRPTNSFVCM